MLNLAIINLNSKLRRKGNISEYKINASRDQETVENLKIDDKTIRQEQLEKRKDSRTPPTYKPIQVGDTIWVKNRYNKHKADGIYRYKQK